MKNGEANAGALPEPEVLARNEYGVPIARGYTANTLRAMMAERDAARASAAEWQASAEHNLNRRLSALGQVNALRQCLWDVYAALGCDTDGDPTPAALVGDLGALVLAAAKEAAKDYREACDAIPPDAREGREPLTIKALSDEMARLQDVKNFDAYTHSFIEGVRFAERMHGIGPAGTSADGAQP